MFKDTKESGSERLSRLLDMLKEDNDKIITKKELVEIIEESMSTAEEHSICSPTHRDALHYVLVNLRVLEPTISEIKEYCTLNNPQCLGDCFLVDCGLCQDNSFPKDLDIERITKVIKGRN